MMRYLFLIVIIVTLLSAGCSPAVNDSASVPTEEPFYAPDFTLATLDGSEITLRALRPKWVIVNFWATWCVPCVQEMPLLQQIADTYPEQLVMLGINMRESRAEIESFLMAVGITFPILIDPYDSMLVEYSVTGLPQTLIVDPSGEIVQRSFGPLDANAFPALIADLLQ